MLILTNQTMRDVVIPFINQTAGDLIAFVNRTRFQPWNATLNETICFLNRTSVVLRNKANETYLVLQANAMEAWQNLTSEESIARMKAYLNTTKTRIISGLRVANETIFPLRNKSVTFVIELTMELKEYIQQLVENAKITIRSRDSLINKYPVMYLNMTVFEVSKINFKRMFMSSLSQ